MRGKKPVRCGSFAGRMFCDQTEHLSGCSATVTLGPVNSLSERAAWKLFQPYLDRVNASHKAAAQVWSDP